MKVVTKYQCGDCEMVWEKQLEAEDCCRLEVKEIFVYVCDKCAEEHETEKEAFDCCDQMVLGNYFKDSPKEINV